MVHDCVSHFFISNEQEEMKKRMLESTTIERKEEIHENTRISGQV